MYFHDTRSDQLDVLLVFRPQFAGRRVGREKGHEVDRHSVSKLRTSTFTLPAEIDELERTTGL